jgi:preprotein translocase subunit YajC
MQLVPIVFMLGVFYFLIMRPQMRKQKELQDFLAALKHGDSVVTNGGMLGVIREIQGGIVTLEISQGVRVKFLKSQIAQSADAVARNGEKAPSEVKT